MDIADHVSKQMLKHYSHIRIEAKRSVLEAILKKPIAEPTESQVPPNRPTAIGRALHRPSGNGHQQPSAKPAKREKETVAKIYKPEFA